jgi:hypothetical protein
MKRTRLILDIFESGTVELATEEDARIDRYSAFSSDIEAMLNHVRDLYYQFIHQGPLS